MEFEENLEIDVVDGFLGEEHVVALGQTVLHEHKELLPLLFFALAETQYPPQVLHVGKLEGFVVVSGDKDQQVDLLGDGVLESVEG